MHHIDKECKTNVESLPDGMAVTKKMAANLLGISRYTLYDYLDGLNNYLAPHQRPTQWDWQGEPHEPISKNSLRVLLVLKQAIYTTKNREYAINNLSRQVEDYFNGLQQERYEQ